MPLYTAVAEECVKSFQGLNKCLCGIRESWGWVNCRHFTPQVIDWLIRSCPEHLERLVLQLQPPNTLLQKTDWCLQGFHNRCPDIWVVCSLPKICLGIGVLQLLFVLLADFCAHHADRLQCQVEDRHDALNWVAVGLHWSTSHSHQIIQV